ncbi:helicase DnaB [Cohnella pontilimi]|uniref:Helicase DnaB n=1 Tax=Cohnella pontilimi TaxID=2564100 RepID=A0A4U0F598_9BACL|nr:DnaD domain protein [Cohnella pontilimi]TJY39781.1 helicase DnaB [Cohnella pontilimi]
MRVSNILEFTENHRFFVCREFALDGLKRKLLASLYQPMIGAFSAGLYHFLYHFIAEDSAGCTRPDSQRALFLGLGLEPNAAGRKTLIEAASRLEAVGLLQVFRHHNPLTEETLFEYALQSPLGASEFFSNLHLTLLLRDKIGKPALLELKRGFISEPPAELARFVNREEVTVPFYELFQIGTGPVDPELDSGWTETAPARESAQPPERIRHADMLLRFPRGAANRGLVERLGRAPESMAQLNFLAYKYDLDVPEICRLLDEDGIFGTDGTLLWDELNRRAHLIYRQDRKRDEERERFLSRGESRGHAESEDAGVEPEDAAVLLDVPERFQGTLTPERYNRMLRNEPYTRMLEKHFPGAVPDSFVRIFERIDLNYKLPEPVINVLAHYIFGMKHAQRLTHAFIDSIASNMLAKGIDTFEKAAAYIREQQKLNATLEKRRRGEADQPAGGSSRTKTQRRKPSIPVVGDAGPVREISPEEREKMRELARKLKGDHAPDHN